MNIELPHDLQDAVDFARQARAGAESSRRALATLDLTSLTNTEAPEDIGRLVQQAERYGLASVCVAPRHVATAHAARRTNARVRIATVVNFPTGRCRTFGDELATASSTARDVTQNNAAGANQNDIVLDFEAFIGARRAGRDADLEPVAEKLRAARSNAGTSTLMVIISTAAFDDAGLLREACEFCAQIGPDCLKSDTGFHPAGGVTMERAAVMMSVAKRFGLGVKISAGIKDEHQAAQYQTLATAIYGIEVHRNLNLFRIGASSVLPKLLHAAGLDALPAPPPGPGRPAY